MSIGDYALIGDCRSAALVSRGGSIDWLCWPRFDSGSYFAALLDREKGGSFALRPACTFESTRRYVPDTNVLETTFRTAGGVVRLTDLMPVDSEAAKARTLWPQHEILRRVECIEGSVPLRVICAPRPDYARAAPRLRHRGALGFFCEYHDEVLILRGDFPLAIHGDAIRGEVTLRQGERACVSLVFTEGEPAVLPPLGSAADARSDASIRWWSAWSNACRYDGPWRDALVRSALALKLMAYAPSGAVIAAPTTSLPEKLGGERNWDYRYCWLRDASLTTQALLDLGHDLEANAFLDWLLHTTRITEPQLEVLYTLYGEPRANETTLDHLAGYANSRPVRIGNAAELQLQLDVYGDVIDAVYQHVIRGGTLDKATARMVAGFARTVCEHWRDADEGIWEIRAGRAQHTYSKGMCWVALDRLLELDRRGVLHLPPDSIARERDAIRAVIEQEGFNPRLGSYVATLGGDWVDASLLKLARHGCLDAKSERTRGTIRRILEDLGVDGLLYRYRVPDGLPPGEGAFGVCSFWAIAARAMAGDLDAAERSFEHLLSFGNDVGLFAEEIDPETGAPLGNFPQAFTHVGLIDAALVLHDVHRNGTVRPA